MLYYKHQLRAKPVVSICQITALLRYFHTGRCSLFLFLHILTDGVSNSPKGYLFLFEARNTSPCINSVITTVKPIHVLRPSLYSPSDPPIRRRFSLSVIAGDSVVWSVPASLTSPRDNLFGFSSDLPDCSTILDGDVLSSTCRVRASSQCTCSLVIFCAAC